MVPVIHCLQLQQEIDGFEDNYCQIEDNEARKAMNHMAQKS